MEGQAHPVDEFEALLGPILDTAFRVALRMTRNRDDASDLVQDAVLNALKGFSTFEPGTNFRAWFLRILTHAYLRTRRTAKETESLDVGEAADLFLFLRTGDLGDDPAQTFMDRLAVEQVEVAIDRLPEDYRLTMSLYLLNDLPYEEIAGIVGCPVGTVRSRIHRGRNILQRELWALAPTEVR